MPQILDHNTDSVYTADIHGAPVHRPQLQSVTFVNALGAVHTVMAHADSELDDAQAIVAAHERGELTVTAPEASSGTNAVGVGTETERQEAETGQVTRQPGEQVEQEGGQ